MVVWLQTRPPIGLPTVDCIQWRRASAIAGGDHRVFVGRPLSGHIKQGALEDTGFIGACAVRAYALPSPNGTVLTRTSCCVLDHRI